MKQLIIILLCCCISVAVLANGDSTKTAVPETEETLAANANVVYGIASFYSASFEGLKTATGEVFKQAGLTAASNHFKLNTWVKVTNMRNGRSVIVRINDRMSKRMSNKGRVVDLSRSAAKMLGFIGAGLTKVSVIPVQPTAAR